ncbi:MULTISPECIES: sugar porter family MFS transporter [unclassified Streptomyces]|uniref:sugar porter family MFS transporter n=1 Tax=unclassified Streptomyces TaxID=2593676 RepID=UPI002DD893BA|nr:MULTISPECIES: sugar porter family MFS transporter [unclassified Streptomyces]WSA90151.1 sugar porter family MFS transporter [Streptomyces sp. NBC_01795]WSS17239.1 sugar porter family MFS transporter [Streptomyces sp. NBC_01186]WSS45982.1 sugar porter family MFS transporter [Streptomyces sp. NBC_01187]
MSGEFTAVPTNTRAAGRPPRRVVLVSIVGAIGGFLFGFDTAVINGAVDPIEENFALDAMGLGTVVAITLFGAAVGALLAGWMADRIGRPRVMGIAAVVFAASSLGCGTASDFWSLSAWRLLTGIAVGYATVLGPLYISEIAPAAARGRLASFQQMAIVLGIFAALLSDSLIAAVLGGADAERFLGLPAWRWMFIVGAVPASIYGILSLRIPESPRHLAARGCQEAAYRVLANLHGISRDQAERDVARMGATLSSEHRPRFRDMFCRRTGLLPVVWAGVGIAALQALVGVDVIFYYSTSLWKSVGFGESASFGLSVLSSLINVVSTVVAIVLIDRIGRRRLLLAGSAGMAVSLLLMSIGFSRSVSAGENLVLPGAWGPLTLIGANAFVVCFAVSWGPVVWVLLGEMFPNAIRGVALALAASVNWISGVAVNLSFPTLREISLPGSYALYGVMALLSWFLVRFGVRETMNRELEDMSAAPTALKPQP